MVTTKTQIANMALARVGSARVADVATDTSNTAQLCRDFLDNSIGVVVEAAPWAFTTKRVTLGADHLQNAPTWGFDNAYQLPNDFLALQEVQTLEEHEWRIEGTTILCNEPSISITYTAGPTDTALFNSHVVLAMVFLLASHLAFPITKNQRLADTLYGFHIDRLARAENIDGRTGHDSYAPDDLIAVRRMQ